ncbi:amidohydrolase [Pseudalkalibacillus hwajinpoensis]|uniref:amidohydrolase n=1 Tax=Guptibacillus hwajinpoensis TaxID=208199 RepID=UPI001CD2617E|nr:amidohydrolase [Pseudalkalibacillus hwajinpoensis]MCA0991482.1 amidohydrolase [Pseudalkalibacillus hwajinpoensis]
MQADIIFFNGEVVTVDEAFSIKKAVAIKGNRILATCTNEEVAQFQGKHTQLIDLQGRSLLPGFIDAHAHLELFGTNYLDVNCKEVSGIDDIIKKLSNRVPLTSKGEWIRGWGYNQNALGRHLTRWDLDQVSTEHPIIVVRTCGHLSCVNSKALEMAGITHNTPDPSGGKYGRENGELTGVLLESAHMNFFLQAMHSEEQIQTGLKIASEHFLKHGITSVHDAGGYGPSHIRSLQKAVSSKAIQQRVYTLYGSLHESGKMVEKGLASGIVTGLGDEWFKIGPAKVFIDGSSSGPTAKTREPYSSNPDDSGILYLQQDELDQSLIESHRKGWQITAHAIGDQAVEMMLRTIERGLADTPINHHRHRIEHAAMTPSDLLERMGSLKVIPIPNPAFLYEFGDGYVQDYGDRTQIMFPLKDFVENNIPFAIGSDSPITDVNPLLGIYAAVTRHSKSGNVIGNEQGISIQDAIKAYTLSGAYASFEENEKGSIESGKLADFVILNESILTCKPDRLKEVSVDLTMINGEIVFSNQKEGVL